VYPNKQSSISNTKG